MTDLDVLMDLLEEAEALLLEPRDTFDRALIGITEGLGQDVAVYDVAKCVAALMDMNGWDHDEALEWFDYNTVSAYVGEATPVFVNVMVQA